MWKASETRFLDGLSRHWPQLHTGLTAGLLYPHGWQQDSCVFAPPPLSPVVTTPHIDDKIVLKMLNINWLGQDRKQDWTLQLHWDPWLWHSVHRAWNLSPANLTNDVSTSLEILTACALAHIDMQEGCSQPLPGPVFRTHCYSHARPGILSISTGVVGSFNCAQIMQGPELLATVYDIGHCPDSALCQTAKLLMHCVQTLWAQMYGSQHQDVSLNCRS